MLHVQTSLRLLIAILFTVLLSACKDAPAEGPAAPGPFALCSYKDSLDAAGYASARLSYPCNAAETSLPAVTLTGGLTNVKEQMYWLADHLTSHGYIVLTVTPNNVFGGVRYWEDAHRDAFATLLRENRRQESPVAFRIDEKRISLVGYSNGGAGVLGVARELGSSVNNVIAMAPYFSPVATPDFSALTATTLILQGSLDTTTLPQVARKLHEGLPANADRLYAQFKWVTHFDWIALGRFHNKFKMVITAWLERTQRQSTAYEGYLSGEQHKQHLEQGWYDRFVD